MEMTNMIEIYGKTYLIEIGIKQKKFRVFFISLNTNEKIFQRVVEKSFSFLFILFRIFY